MTEEYAKLLQIGLEYQDFVMLQLMKELGLPLTNFSAQVNQYNIGENTQGIEIKFDGGYERTGNLYIEIAEKSNKNNRNFVASGVMRNDNSWLYAIGNYSKLFIFGKKILKMQFSKTDKSKIKQTPTSRGFLLDTNGQKTALKILEFDNKEV